ncbi:30S ribosomal protein S13 [Candidatus Bathyarchaeota archaeon]|nr:MAG: 30S ribosomal protein S13 [Candidatus Bathyarchaeota archaeon]
MSTEFRHIVRLLGRDLDGTKKVAFALTNIKGINLRLADAILKKANIPQEKRLGFLSEAEARRIEETVINLQNQDLPVWLFNRRKDPETGEDVHLTTSDLDLQIKADIERMKAIKSWRGYRHAYGLKVRGQRTRTTGRKGRSVGVRKRRG